MSAELKAAKPTNAQRERLRQVSNGHLSKSGSGWHVFYHMKNSSSPTWDMVDRLEKAGWIEWAGGNVARLTDAGRAAYSGIQSQRESAS